MKKRLLLGLLAAPLVLASCGGDTPAESKDPTTSQGDTLPGGESAPASEAGNSQGEQPGASSEQPAASSEPELTRAEKVTALFAKMATGASSTFVDPTYRTLEYYGEDKGVLSIYTDEMIEYGAYNGGVLKIANYGLFQYSYDLDTETVDDYLIYATNTALNISDVVTTTKTLGQVAANVQFAESARTHTFSTSDAAFVTAFAGVVGYGEDTAALYPTKKVEFKVSDDGLSLTNFSLTLSGSTDRNNKDIKEEGFKIEKVGKTIDLGVEDFIANPPSFRAPTNWSAAATSVFGQIATGFSLPFPTGATWASYEDVTTSAGVPTFLFVDYKCGDKTTTYKTQVEAAGFTLNAGETDATQKYYVYEKELAPATDTSNQIMQRLEFIYVPSTGTVTLHPAGQFLVMSQAYEVEETITVDELNGILATKMSYEEADKPILPTFNLGTNGGVVYQDATAEMAAQYPAYDQLFYGVIKIYFATEAEAQAAILALANQLEAAGYEEDVYTEYMYGLDLVFDKTDGSDGVMSYDCFVYGMVAYDDDGNYAGYIMLEIDHSGYAG